MKSRFWATAAALLAAVTLLSVPAQAVSAQKAILVDGATGRVLYEKDASARSLIASTTKIMTALIVCEQCNVLDRMNIPKEAVGIEGSSMYLQEGEVLTVQDLLYGLMLSSGNDAAVALAIYCGGTVEGFVEMMNDKSHRLGLKGTHFENPHGLDSPNHYSTAEDLAKLGIYAMKNPIFAQTVSTKSVRVGKRSLQNHNKLLWRVEGSDGIKTGFTKKAGRILVSSAQRDGRRLVCVTINDGNDWLDHAQLLNRGFSAYTVREIFRAGDCLGTVELIGGTSAKVDVLATGDFSFPLEKGEEPQVLLSAPGFAFAPVVQGEKAGMAYVCIGDACVGKIPVVYAGTVEMKKDPPSKPFWERWLRG